MTTDYKIDDWTIQGVGDKTTAFLGPENDKIAAITVPSWDTRKTAIECNGDVIIPDAVLIEMIRRKMAAQ